eukprot:PhM_4_TR14185/c1_g1_i2/m.80726
MHFHLLERRTHREHPLPTGISVISHHAPAEVPISELDPVPICQAFVISTDRGFVLVPNVRDSKAPLCHAIGGKRVLSATQLFHGETFRVGTTELCVVGATPRLRSPRGGGLRAMDLAYEMKFWDTTLNAELVEWAVSLARSRYSFCTLLTPTLTPGN